MSDSLSNLILSLTPDDGSTIGNGAMMALLREQVPSASTFPNPTSMPFVLKTEQRSVSRTHHAGFER